MTTLNKLIENKNKEFDQLIYKELLNYGYEAFIVLVKDFLSQSIKAGYELAIKDVEKLESLEREGYSVETPENCEYWMEQNNKIKDANQLRFKIKLQLQSLLKEKL